MVRDKWCIIRCINTAHLLCVLDWDGGEIIASGLQLSAPIQVSDTAFLSTRYAPNLGMHMDTLIVRELPHKRSRIEIAICEVTNVFSHNNRIQRGCEQARLFPQRYFHTCVKHTLSNPTFYRCTSGHLAM